MATMHSPPTPAQNLQAPDLNIILMCKDCRSVPPNIVESFASGDLVCGDCGLVLGDRIIDTRSEWRTFADDDGDDPSRVGAAANPLLNGSQLDTVISQRDGGSKTALALARAHGRATSQKGERDLVQAYKEISAMTDAIGLPKNIADSAKQLYKRVQDEKLLKVHNNSTTVIAACIFIACRNSNVPRTFKEICALTRVPKKSIGKCFKALAKVLETPDSTSSSSARDLLSRFCSNLNLPMPVQRVAEEITEAAKDISGIAGRSPISVAAACIYLASHLLGRGTTAKDIAVIAGVSDVTIRGAYRYLYACRDDIIKKEQDRNPEQRLFTLPSP